MKIYYVREKYYTCYSFNGFEWDLRGIFSSKEKAEDYVKLNLNPEDFDIEEAELDKEI